MLIKNYAKYFIFVYKSIYFHILKWNVFTICATHAALLEVQYLWQHFAC